MDDVCQCLVLVLLLLTNSFLCDDNEDISPMSFQSCSQREQFSNYQIYLQFLYLLDNRDILLFLLLL